MPRSWAATGVAARHAEMAHAEIASGSNFIGRPPVIAAPKRRRWERAAGTRWQPDAEKNPVLPPFQGVGSAARETARSLHASFHDHERPANVPSRLGFSRLLRLGGNPCLQWRRAEFPTAAPWAVGRERVPNREARAEPSD